MSAARVSVSNSVYTWALPWNLAVGCVTPEDVAVVNARERESLVVPNSTEVQNPSFFYFSIPKVPNNGLILNPISPIYLVASPVFATISSTGTLVPATAPNVFTYLAYESSLIDSENFAVPRIIPVRAFDVTDLLLASSNKIPSGFSFSNITFDLQVLQPEKSSDLASSLTVRTFTAKSVADPQIGSYFLTTTVAPPAIGATAVPIYASGTLPTTPPATYAVLEVIARPNATARFVLTFSPSTESLSDNYLWISLSTFTAVLLQAVSTV